ncbi:MarC family protein [Limisalsivibrio acetivorans]|uniref:MarC family protein n=1 Tax=Limisalsivibrio acetivorans TaxID=1304888 RepID=UPI00047C955C|nr:MarC family protein [Limisalsivibrio acetivorans]
MNETFKFAVLCFTSLFTMINPLGVIPLYISMTGGMSAERSRHVVYKALTVSFVVMVVFALTGEFIFRFFGISVNGFRIVGGIILFGIGYDMLGARISRKREADENEADFAGDIAITPIAIPVITGPGVITMVIVLMQEAQTAVQTGLLFAMILFVCLLTAAMLLSGKGIMSFLGDNGNKVLMRIMGLIVMVISVEFFFKGLTPIVRHMLMIEG